MFGDDRLTDSKLYMLIKCSPENDTRTNTYFLTQLNYIYVRLCKRWDDFLIKKIYIYTVYIQNMTNQFTLIFLSF